MTTRRRNQRAEQLANRLHRNATTIPNIQDHLNEQRAHITTIAATKTDGSHSTKGDISDPTQRTALELDRIDNHQRAINDALASIEIGINLLDEACRAALGHHTRTDSHEPRPRCIGDNTAAGANCWQIPATRRNPANQTVDDGRCLDCGTRHDERLRTKATTERKRRHTP